MTGSRSQFAAAKRKSFLIRRARILRELRRIMDERGYLEVETPLRVRSPGTDVNLEAFCSEERYLITSPEFHMKRLLAEGFMRLYQIGHCFRRDEKTHLHNPEFTMLEFYSAGLSLEGMMREIEEVLGATAAAIGVREVHHAGRSCDIRPPWTRISVDAAFRQDAGWSPVEAFDEDRFYFDLVDKVDRHLDRDKPTILFHYPAPLAMLAQLHPADARIARRFEVYIAGVEIANAFEELTDSQEQHRRFKADLARRRLQGKPIYPVDESFLKSVGAMPPCSGIAVGVDRLVMLLLGAGEVNEVMAFPEETV